MRNQQSHVVDYKAPNPIHEPDADVVIEPRAVTFVLREFEDFENNVLETLQRLNAQVPDTPIVVISDSLPYPPLKLPKTVESVNLVTLKIEPNVPLTESRPENLIKSNFIIILPDGVRMLDSSSVIYMLDFYSKQRKNVRIVAWPIGSHSNLQCQSLSVNLKQWKLEYGPGAQSCDSIYGHSVILLQRRDLFNLSNSFIRPVGDSLFIQSALRGWKSVIGDKVLFEQVYDLYSDPHFAWKHKKEEQARKKNLYREFGIKLVKQEDGMERLYGCTKVCLFLIYTVYISLCFKVLQCSRGNQNTMPYIVLKISTLSNICFIFVSIAYLGQTL